MKTLFGIVVLVFFICAVQVKAQNPDLSKVKANIEKMNDTYDKAFISGDYTTMNSFYTDDAIVMPSYHPMVKGKDAILESDKKDMGSMKTESFKTTPTDVYGSGDLVYEIGTYDISFTPPNTTTAMNDHGKYLNIWQKQGDTWKIKVNTWNSDVNPMPMAGAKTKDDMGK
jgi:ketosteroid isomerase-like protein